MKTKAVRLYGVNDLRMEEFDLPEITDGEILAEVISDSVCMSSYKAASQGPNHKRVPNDVAENPIIIGHEFCGKLIKVGAKWADKFKAGDKFVIQPAMNYKGSLEAPGYSYKYCGGASQYVILPEEVMITDCLLPFDGDAYFYGSLAEPMSCIDYAVHGGNPPKLLVVTDLDDARLSRAAELITPEDAKKYGVDLRYINTGAIENPVEYLRSLTDGEGYNDVFVYAPVKPVVEMGDALLSRDGCLNFFAGPTKTDFSAMFNFYNVHYGATHIVGTSGGNTDDMRESISLMEKKLINPAGMITHIGGLNACAETTLTLPQIKGAKKLIYTHVELPLTAIEDFGKAAEENAGTALGELYAKLDAACKAAGDLWCAEAEKILLAYAGVEA